MTAKPIGLLAGWGRFPLAFVRKAHGLGQPVVTVGFRGEADPELACWSAAFHWTAIARMGRIIRLFKRAGAERIVLAGKIHKFNYIYKPWKLFTLLPDWRTAQWWFFGRRRDNGDDNLLLSVIDEFARDGLVIDSALNLCPELLVTEGLLTRRGPTAAETRDITFGWNLAKRMGDLDVGQCVAVKERSVLAVEAVEGTDRAILRAGELCDRGGFVVVKVAKPRQDMRFDVPTVGCVTIESMRKAGGRVLVIEAAKTIVLDQEETIALADKYGLTIVALTQPPA